MPPRRSTTAGPAKKGSQKTLSFSSKVTKSNNHPPKSFKDTAPSKKSHPSPLSQTLTAKPELLLSAIENEIETGHVSSEAAIASQVQTEQARDKTEEEVRAEKVTDAQIRKYWRGREAERKAPRVHQEGLSVEEKVLRLFDMSSQYGPCIGIARQKRWLRASKLNLNPPIEVLAILLREEKLAQAAFEESMKSSTTGSRKKAAGEEVKQSTAYQRAYVDELMSSKFVIGEA